MRHLITLIAISFLSVQMQAQISIERSDFTLEPDERVVFWYLDSIDVELPNAGEDMVWDYSEVSVGTGYFVDYEASNNDAFPEPGFTSPSTRNFLGGLAIQRGKFYDFLNDESYGRVGLITESIDVALGALTGGANDTIKVLGKVYQYDPQATFIKFPLLYNDTWSYDYTINSDFEVSVAAFALQDTPAGQLTRDSSVYEVSGYGTIVLPNPGGSGTVSVEALMVVHKEYITYNYLLGGQPAPQLMLDLFGLQQEEKANFVTYLFYAEGLPAPAAEMGLDENCNVAYFVIPDDIKDVISSSAEESTAPKPLRAFPNPLYAGGQWSLQVPMDVINGNLQLLDATGRQVGSWNVSAAQNDVLQFTISNELQSGLYLYRLVDANRQLKGVGKLQILR